MADGYIASVDWNDDGDFTDPQDDVTDDVLGLTYSYGRAQARQLSPPAVGSTSFALCNTDRIYSPENSGSPIAADFDSASATQVQVTLDAVVYGLGTGRIDTYTVHPDRDNRTVDITSLDGLAELQNAIISTEVLEAARTGQIVEAILDAAGWDGPRDIDLGATFVPWWWAESVDAFTALQEILRAEGPPSVAYVAPDGTFTYRDRHHRILNTVSLTSQALFSAPLVDCATVPATGTSEIGQLVGLDSAVTLPTDDFATVTIPGTVTVGDLLIVGSVMPSGSRTFTISGGAGAWKSLGSAAQPGHTSQLWWRIAEAGDLGATVTVTPSTPNIRQVALLGSVSNVDTANPIVGATGVTTTSTAMVTTPTVSAVPAGSREVSVLWDSRGNSVPQTSNWTAPAGQTRRIQDFTTASSGASSGAMGDSDATVSGVVGGRRWVPDQLAVGSAWTIAVKPAEPGLAALNYTAPVGYEHGARDIINSVVDDVEERVPDAGLSVVWSSNDTISLAIGESRQITVQASDPFRDAQNPEAGVDYISSGPGTVTVTLSRTFGQSATITFLAVGGSTTLTNLQLRARAIPVARTVQVVLNDSLSVQRHGIRTNPDPIPWANANDTFAVANLLLAHYATRRPTVSIRVVSQDTAHREQILGRTVSDRITIVNGELGLDADFHIEQVEHTVDRITVDNCRIPVHDVVFSCERTLTTVVNPFTFDKTGAGFDDGVFDPSAADNPSTVFIFDHETQGQFGVGQFGN